MGTEGILEPLTAGSGLRGSGQPWLVDIFVGGNVRPKGSPGIHVNRRSGRRFVRESPATVGWEKRVADKVALELRSRPGFPIDGPVEVDLRFRLPRRKRDKANLHLAELVRLAARRPDLDKLERTVLDALTGIVYTDDAHVVWLFGKKRLAKEDEPPGVRIRVRL